MAGFTVSLMSDVRSWLKGTQQVEKSTADMADALDQLAEDTARSADDAGDALAHKFSEAYEKVKAESKAAGREIADDVRTGSRRAADGLDEFKNEGRQSIRETAASFSDVTDGLDLVQEVAANAFAGFGPAGMAAGALAAVGIGAATSALQAAQEQAEELRRETVDLGKEFANAASEAVGIGEALNDALAEDAERKPWAWMGNVDRLTLWQKAVEQIGVTQADVLAAASGDLEAYQRIVEQTAYKTIDGQFGMTKQFVDDLGALGDKVRNAKQWGEDYTDWKARDTEVTQKATAATGELTDAQKQAQQAAEQWASALADNLSVADEGLDKFTKKGVLNVDKWADEVKRRARQNARIEDFKVDVFPKLSPEAEQNFAALPAETQNQIAKAYAKGDKGERKKIRQTLEAEVDVKTSTKDTKVDPVTIPVSVDQSDVEHQTASAATAAQIAADRPSNRVELQVRIDHDDLQRAVDRAAASISRPTIYANVKVQKENP